MSFIAFAVGWLAFNLIFAALSAFAASRWGRDPFGWLLVGAVLGPLAFLTLVALHRDDLRRGRPTLTGGGGGGEPPRAKILVAADGSEPGRRAVEWVVGHFAGTLSEVTVATVLPLEQADAVSGPSDSPRTAMLEAEIETRLAAACATLRAAGMACRTVTRFGDSATEILALADEGDFELTVMGRRGRGGVAKLLLGSVSEKVVKTSSRPVMVIS